MLGAGLAVFAVLWLSVPAGAQTTNHPSVCPVAPAATVASGQPLVLPGSPCADPDGQPVTLILVEAPRHGTLTGPANGMLTYTSNAGYSGTDTIRFKGSDGTSESAVSTLTITVTGGGGGQEDRQPTVQQMLELGAMLPGMRQSIEIYVRELVPGQPVSVRIEPSQPVRAVSSACAPAGAAYLCALRGSAGRSTATLALQFVAGAPGTFTLTSRNLATGASDTDSVEILPKPVAARSLTLLVSACFSDVFARAPGAHALTRVCNGRTLPVGSRVTTIAAGADVYWSQAGRTRSIGVNNSKATLSQRGGALELRLAKPHRCRGYEQLNATKVRDRISIVGRLAHVTFVRKARGARWGGAFLREHCDRARIAVANGTIVVRDRVHRRTVRLSARGALYKHLDVRR